MKKHLLKFISFVIFMLSLVGCNSERADVSINKNTSLSVGSAYFTLFDNSGTLSLFKEFVSDDLIYPTVTDEYERTFLHYAFIHDQDETGDYLIESGWSVEHKDFYGKTPLDYRNIGN